MIRIWRAYSCNNSSSFRLVARFADAATAADVAAELAVFFAEHARQIDAQGGDPEPTEVATELARKYGFTWSDILYWGIGGLAGDEPELVAVDDVLFVYHGHCGGFGDLPLYLEARGGTVDDDTEGSVHASVLFKYPGNQLDDELREELDEELANMRGQIDDDFYTDGLIPPWSDYQTGSRCVVFHDAATVGLYVEVRPAELAQLRKWMIDYGVAKGSVKLEEHADFHAFAKAATARCTACGGVLEYLDPRIDDIEKPQLVCRPCGGFYDLEAFP